MIPDIGFMVGAYIIVRMIALLGRPIDPASNAVHRLLTIVSMVGAVVAIAVTAFVMVDLFLGGTNDLNMPKL